MRIVTFMIRSICDRAITMFDHVWVVSKDDRLSRKPRSLSHLANIPWDHAALAIYPATHNMDSKQVLFVGNLGFRPNLDALLRFLRDVWPGVSAACPDATIVAVGQLPKERLLGEWTRTPGLTLAGRVSTLATYYANSAISICPVEHGGGSSIKAIESLSYGVPCVLSPHSFKQYRHMFGESTGMVCAQSDEAFAGACIGLLRDRTQRRTIGLAGRGLVECHYTPSAFDSQVEADIRSQMRGYQSENPYLNETT